MIKKSVSQAHKALEEIWEINDSSPSSFKGLTKSQIIRKLRKTREELWKEKIRHLENRS